MEAAKSAVIGERLVAGVDERAVELHPFVNIGLDEIGALGNLVRNGLARVQFPVAARRLGHADTARAHEEDAYGEKGEERVDVALGQRRIAIEEVVLVAT